MAVERAPIVLIVEDDPGIAELEKLHLEEAGYQVKVAGTAQAALACLQGGGIDLVLLDYMLPDLNGLDFYDRLKEGGFDLPVILVTALSDQGTILKALRAHVRDFVTKSVEYLDYLPQTVNRVLRQVETERQLAESEARLAAVFSSAKDAIIIAEADQRIRLFNTAAEQMFRCPAAQALGQPLTNFIEKELYSPNQTEGQSTGSLTQLVRWGSRGKRADGEEFPLEASISQTNNGGQKLYTVVVRDISERKRAEERLREQAVMLDNATDAILILDLEERVRYWNRGAERMYGWPAEEAIGRHVGTLHCQDHLAQREEPHRAMRERGEWIGELPQVNREGRRITVESRWTLVRDDAGQPRGVLIIDTDVTERKKLEAQFHHAQRMEGVGMLAGGIAHDFNNLITIIIGYSEILLSQLKPGERAYGQLREIRNAGERAASLTRQLLAFSRKQILQPRILDLNSLVAETEKMLRRLIGEDIDLASSLEPGLGKVKVDPGQIEQILINLAVNARDAMPTGGHLTIETRNVDWDGSYTQENQEVRPGPYVMLAVTDSGTGMDEATKARLFEPFFTTKEVGKGTGLGLATVYGIVKQSGGHIAVSSELGRGTTFKIYLPRVAETAPPGPSVLPLNQMPKGNETILLAEDEGATREMIRLALQTQGYTVLEAEDGEQAVQVCRQHTGPIHLLITDVIMPRIGGGQLAEFVKGLRSEMKVLFLSGYTDDAVVRHGIVQEKVAFLQKPFSLSGLARKVREVLDARAR
jgi:two-component system cell cycle sensor histidine kinase/response regulator CckA